MTLQKNKRIAIMLSIVAMAVFFVGCDDTATDKEGSGSETEDTDTETNGMLLGDSDTMPPSVFDAIDCAGSGSNPDVCESALCTKNNNFYFDLLIGCQKNPSNQCDAQLGCYDKWLSCMLVPCPPGAAAPQTTDERRAAGFYDCNAAYDSCIDESSE